MGGMMGMQGQMGMMGGGVMQPPMGMMGAMGGLINPATIVGDVSLLDKTGSGAAVPSGSAAPDLEELLNRLGLRDKLLPKLLENDIDSVAELRLLTEDDFKEMGISIGIRRKLLEEMGKSPQSPAAPSGGGGLGFVSGGGMTAPSPSTASAGGMFGGMALTSAMPPAPPAAPAVPVPEWHACWRPPAEAASGTQEAPPVGAGARPLCVPLVVAPSLLRWSAQPACGRKTLQRWCRCQCPLCWRQLPHLKKWTAGGGGGHALEDARRQTKQY
jgi:hypothetical protein